ncbi:hypothetical protein [Falsarthrobacter nasiphocae]|uniref:Uncharacterized protein n=1 Tax=Falsarthrobacter nasiphocae TaxID=189863 RepID=A0AAE3YHG0_9MICC|nr:hypothetical protein [Falsarthrobacter nasiphocae]MDR6891841.1 hypothetical protein [Falsarthrobacter nasiphocae]
MTAKRINQIVSAVILTLCLASTPLSAQAVEGAKTTPTTPSTTRGTDIIDITNQSRATIEAAQARTESGGVILHAPSSSLDWTKAKVVSAAGITLVTVPLNKAGNQWSNFTVEVKHDGTLGGYTEQHFRATGATSGRVTIYTNGQKVLDRVSTAPEDTQSEIAFGLMDAVCELNDCLASAGIPGWVVAGATAVCGAAGGWVGVVSCYGAAAIAGGTLGWCTSRAVHKLPL